MLPLSLTYIGTDYWLGGGEGRPDLKSDILTIMDPVRLDLRNKFYLARNYQKRGGQYHFSHDFVYII